ncbi:hypothetical protein BN1723_004935 [Verticillium longisporum]|uniref:Uncharacterized protein n=1 Tax=Verticillium longisporum TaxID=100787 RepID=A0A0G4N309_VERLO|nr:hypothetical protein BN1723_004935 [Verticillium longisporum]
MTVMTKEGRAFQSYRFKFSQNESVRTQLFAELQAYNDKLEKLLDSSDKHAHLVQQASEFKSRIGDNVICQFWMKAARVLYLLADAWNCHCSQQHCANLQLQHRTGKKSEFNFWFEATELSQWATRKARISEDAEQSTALDRAAEDLESLVMSEPNHRQGQPAKSAMRSTPRIEALMAPPSMVLTPKDTAVDGLEKGPISSLCASLAADGESCRGFLADENCRYFVFTARDQERQEITSVTLKQILRGEVRTRPNRRQRYVLSLILASSFVQLLGLVLITRRMLKTPWLPVSLKKGDIVFFREPEQRGVLQLDQPHVSQHFIGSRAKGVEGVHAASLEFSRSLDQLGIILLELCFGDILEEQPCRKRWPVGSSDMERAGFDILAARDWQREVIEEAGSEYADAVGWCLGGNRSAPCGRDEWRQEMLLRVVQPLQRCRDYLVAGGQRT